jgi:hypothetical protein
MAGIVFFKTRVLDRIRDFYVNQIGMQIWLEQPECVILKHGNLLIGFCTGDEPDTRSVIAFVYKSTDDVYEMFKKLRVLAIDDPQVNEKYKIYHFFVKDPEGRQVEFQNFLHPTEPIDIVTFAD